MSKLKMLEDLVLSQKPWHLTEGFLVANQQWVLDMVSEAQPSPHVIVHPLNGEYGRTFKYTVMGCPTVFDEMAPYDLPRFVAPFRRR